MLNLILCFKFSCSNGEPKQSRRRFEENESPDDDLAKASNGLTLVKQVGAFFMLCCDSQLCISNNGTEDTHLLHKGKYYCMADLLFDWLGLSCFVYAELDRDLQVPALLFSDLQVFLNYNI